MACRVRAGPGAETGPASPHDAILPQDTRLFTGSDPRGSGQLPLRARQPTSRLSEVRVSGGEWVSGFPLQGPGLAIPSVPAAALLLDGSLWRDLWMPYRQSRTCTMLAREFGGAGTIGFRRPRRLAGDIQPSLSLGGDGPGDILAT